MGGGLGFGMVHADENPPLVNDPARVAAASIRGYWAQIWRSVLAWMDLGEAERLYLEGAEDFDRVTGLSAETVQVKDVAGNVTLRSSDVIEAIDNAWAHRQRNPRHTTKFRFLSTGGIGVEQGAPFGAVIGGLRLWRECRLSDDAASRERSARAIGDFLLAEGKVSMAVQAYLRGCADLAATDRTDRVGYGCRGGGGDHSADQGPACSHGPAGRCDV